jgi:hypothetical protein
LVELSPDEQIERLHDVARRALHAYNLEGAQITPVRFLNNTVFKVQVRRAPHSLNTYALRVHRLGYRGVAQPRSELCYLEELRRDTGLAVPQPVRA